ncbi:MAG: hypothetical protein V1835_01860 [Candidatus Micrarchaeota archaeon]
MNRTAVLFGVLLLAMSMVFAETGTTASSAIGGGAGGSTAFNGDGIYNLGAGGAIKATNGYLIKVKSITSGLDTGGFSTKFDIYDRYGNKIKEDLVVAGADVAVVKEADVEFFTKYINPTTVSVEVRSAGSGRYISVDATVSARTTEGTCTAYQDGKGCMVVKCSDGTGSTTCPTKEEGTCTAYQDGKGCMVVKCSDGTGSTTCPTKEDGVKPIPTSISINDLPPMPPDGDEEGTFTLKLKAGWNMISFPQYYLSTLKCGNSYDEKCVGMSAPAIKIVENSCGTNVLYHLSKDGRSYEKFDIGLSGAAAYMNGYWIKASGDCRITISGNQNVVESGAYMQKGWNQIGAPNSNVLFEKIKGSCTATSGPWRYNAAARKYEKTEVLVPGEGYFVKIASSCSLGEAEDDLPPFPDDQPIVTPIAVTIKPIVSTNPTILHRSVKDCATQKVLTQEESLRIDPNSQEYYGLKMEDDTLNIQAISLRLFQGGKYMNYECKNRYQEQCVNDGSFDNYYDEWCEYSPIAATPKPTVLTPSPYAPNATIKPTVTPICINIGDGKYYGVGIDCEVISNSGYRVIVKDIAAFSPQRAMIEVLDKYGSLVKRLYLLDGDYTYITEAGNIYIQIIGVHPGAFAKTGTIDILVNSGTTGDCTYNGDGTFGLVKVGCRILSRSGYYVTIKDISAFAPNKAMIEVSDKLGKLIKNVYLGAKEYTTITEAGNLYLQVLEVTPGKIASEGTAAIIVKTVAPTPAVGDPSPAANAQ